MCVPLNILLVDPPEGMYDYLYMPSTNFFCYSRRLVISFLNARTIIRMCVPLNILLVDPPERMYDYSYMPSNLFIFILVISFRNAHTFLYIFFAGRLFDPPECRYNYSYMWLAIFFACMCFSKNSLLSDPVSEPPTKSTAVLPEVIGEEDGFQWTGTL